LLLKINRCQCELDFGRVIFKEKPMKLIVAFSLFVVLTGVAQATQVTHIVPDASSTSFLAGIALGGIALVKRLIR
jgi:VPDSG-CTERM motif